MKAIVRVSNISQVRYYTSGDTDYLRVSYTDGNCSVWSVNNNEGSMNERKKREELEVAYNRISNACRAVIEFVEFDIPD